MSAFCQRKAADLKTQPIKKEVGFQGEIVWDNDKPDGTPQKLLDI